MWEGIAPGQYMKLDDGGELYSGTIDSIFYDEDNNPAACIFQDDETHTWITVNLNLVTPADFH